MGGRAIVRRWSHDRVVERDEEAAMRQLRVSVQIGRSKHDDGGDLHRLQAPGEAPGLLPTDPPTEGGVQRVTPVATRLQCIEGRIAEGIERSNHAQCPPLRYRL